MARYSSKPFSSLWNDSWNEKVNMNIIYKEVLTDISFDKQQNKLFFVIKHYHREPKITRYVTSNYVKTPIYEGYSERTRVVKKFAKTINPIKFVNEDILKLDIDKSFILQIIDKIGIIPEWRKKEQKIEVLEKQIQEHKDSFRDFKNEKTSYHFKPTNLSEQASNFWIRFCLGFLTCFLSFIGFISKKQALINKQINAQHKIVIDQKNAVILCDIKKFNKILEDKIMILNNKMNKVKNTEIKVIKTDDEGWNDLKDASIFSYPNVVDKKGVYIIWNKTKDKHYVGQSKNISRRLLQHFKNGDVKNIIFAKDWYNGDYFCYKYYFCETKDQLDSLEKRYIDEYAAFERGYNSTNGNM